MFLKELYEIILTLSVQVYLDTFLCFVLSHLLFNFQGPLCRSYLSASCGRIYILPHFFPFVKRFLKLFSKSFSARSLSLPHLLPSLEATCLLYHFRGRLSSAFQNFFQSFFAPLLRFASSLASLVSLSIIALFCGVVNSKMRYFRNTAFIRAFLPNLVASGLCSLYHLLPVLMNAAI